MEQILRIDMTQQVARYEPFPRQYQDLGGRALTSRLVGDEVDPTCDPLGPHNKLVFAPGLLSGTTLSSSSRISAGAKSPLTQGIKESNSGGQTGWRLAQHGIRALIVEGQAALGQWYIAVVRAEQCEIMPADGLVGLGTFAAAAALRERYGAKAAVAVIGQPGEQLMNVAGIANTDPEGRPSRLCARGGLGAVMGSKGLKAIVVLDPGPNVLPDMVSVGAWRESTKEYHKRLLATPAVDRYRKIGTAGTLEMVNKLGGLPIRNFSRGQDAATEAITGLHMADVIRQRGGQNSHSCMSGCAIQCSNVFVDKDGKEVASSMEFESNTLLGSNLEIFDLDAIAQFTARCNDLGIDTIETGAAIGVAMEGGVLSFGDVAAVLDLLDQMRSGTLLGKLIGAGAAIAGRTLGVRHVPCVKGQAMAAYDPRVIKGNGVTYATSPMGADHTAGNTVGAAVDHLDPQGKVEISREAQIVCTVLDTLGFCAFTRATFPTVTEQVQALFAARLGRPVSVEELRTLALATIRSEVAFNRAAGLGPATDRIPEWMRTEALAPHDARFDVSDEELDRIWEMG